MSFRNHDFWTMFCLVAQRLSSRSWTTVRRANKQKKQGRRWCCSWWELKRWNKSSTGMESWSVVWNVSEFGIQYYRNIPTNCVARSSLLSVRGRQCALRSCWIGLPGLPAVYNGHWRRRLLICVCCLFEFSSPWRNAAVKSWQSGRRREQ